eukprot:1523392-Karenia_brevis.AAC.1
MQSYGTKHLHLGHGCSPEGMRDRWLYMTPKVTCPRIPAMTSTAVKVPAYSSAWEDPKNPMWGRQTEPILVPRGENNQPLYNTIYSDLVAEARPRPDGRHHQWIDR